MNTPTLWAVVPVKSFASAKQRLASLLSADERAGLARAMLQDVLDALVRSPCVAGTLVVTSDAEAAAIAIHAGASVVPDTPHGGLVPAVRVAAGLLASARCAGMLVVPADVPLITPADVELIALGHRASPAVTLVRARSDGGTNALASSPPGALPICFGPESCDRHRVASLAEGIEPRLLSLPRLACDIDRPEDLLHFMEQPPTTRTHAYLADSGIASRLHESRRPPRNLGRADVLRAAEPTRGASAAL